MLPNRPRKPDYGPGQPGTPNECCWADWKYQYTETQTQEFVCWFCGKHWKWDLYVHVWKEGRKA